MPDNTGQKRAVQRLVRGDDGTLRVILVDLDTLLPVTDPTGYKIISAGTSSVTPEPVQSVDTPDVPSQVQIQTTPQAREIPYRSDKGSLDRSATPISTAQRTIEGSLSQKDGPAATPQRSFAAPTSPVSRGPLGPLQNPGRVSIESIPETQPNYYPDPHAARVEAKAVPTPIGQGLASVPGVGYERSYGPNRPYDPEQAQINSVAQAVRNVFGPGYTVVGTSGQEKELGQYGSERHHTGNALDFKIQGPDGKIVNDRMKMEALGVEYARLNPKAGVGYDAGYMGPSTMHLDRSGLGGQWGANESVTGMDPLLNDQINRAREGLPVDPEIPGFADRSTPVAEQVIASAKDVSGVRPIADSRQGVDLRKASPAKMATLGLADWSPDQITTIARAFAGEMSPSQMRHLAEGNPTARAEYAAMLSTLANRAKSGKYQELDKALVGSQYNSLYPENAKVTNANYKKYGKVLEAATQEFLSGDLQPLNPEVTSYLNPSALEAKGLPEPKWSFMMADPAYVGDHKFGELPEYSPSKSFLSERDRMVREGPRGFVPSQMGSQSGPTQRTQTDSARNSLGSPTSAPTQASRTQSDSARNSGSSTSAPTQTSRPGGSGLGGSTTAQTRSPTGGSPTSAPTQTSRPGVSTSNGGQLASDRSGGLW